MNASGRTKVEGRQRIQQLGGFPPKLRGTRQRRSYARPPRFQDGHDSPAQRHPRVSQLRVCRVVDEWKPGSARVGHQLGTWNTKYRPSDRSLSEPPLARDARDSSWTRSAEQIQKYGLDVIVFRMCGAEHVFRQEEPLERVVAGSTRHPFVNARGFPVLRQPCVEHRNIDRQPATDFRALVRPSRGIGVQVVIDMRAAQAQSAVSVSGPRKCVEQRERVSSSTEGDNEAGPGGEPGDESGDCLRSELPGAESTHGDTAGPAQ